VTTLSQKNKKVRAGGMVFLFTKGSNAASHGEPKAWASSPW
jgi:hypothetical protein